MSCDRIVTRLDRRAKRPVNVDNTTGVGKIKRTKKLGKQEWKVWGKVDHRSSLNHYHQTNHSFNNLKYL